MAEPMIQTNLVVITGGHLKQPSTQSRNSSARVWTPEVKEVGGRRFFVADRVDRNFQAFLDNAFGMLDKLVESRNEAVKKEMEQAALEADEMADGGDNTGVPIFKKKQAIDDVHDILTVTIESEQRGSQSVAVLKDWSNQRKCSSSC